jgi:hypothetical protein
LPRLPLAAAAPCAALIFDAAADECREVWLAAFVERLAADAAAASAVMFFAFHCQPLFTIDIVTISLY